MGKITSAKVLRRECLRLFQEVKDSSVKKDEGMGEQRQSRQGAWTRGR